MTYLIHKNFFVLFAANFISIRNFKELLNDSLWTIFLKIIWLTKTVLFHLHRILFQFETLKNCYKCFIMKGFFQNDLIHINCLASFGSYFIHMRNYKKLLQYFHYLAKFDPGSKPERPNCCNTSAFR